MSSGSLHPPFFGRVVRMNIYVGNISFKMTEADLRQAFEPFGSVTSVNLVTDRETGRPRGFAFVEMPNGEEGKKAVESLNGSNIGGRTLTVNEARPREPRAPGGGGGGRGGRY
jgi:RNA recognition motif-containing protein